MNRLLTESSGRSLFERKWLPQLLETFAEPTTQGMFRLAGKELSLAIGGDWSYCQSCRTAQRPIPGRITCANCGHDSAEPIDPDTDPVFVARKGYYRTSTLAALESPPRPPLALIAAEHTAQVNTRTGRRDILQGRRARDSLPGCGLGSRGHGPRETGDRRPFLYDHYGGWHRHWCSFGGFTEEHAAGQSELPTACRPRRAPRYDHRNRNCVR